MKQKMGLKNLATRGQAKVQGAEAAWGRPGILGDSFSTLTQRGYVAPQCRRGVLLAKDEYQPGDTTWLP